MRPRTRLRRVAAVVGALCVMAATAAAAPGPDGAPPTAPTVRTESGPVRGVRSGAHDVYYGIPYAGPPTGRHRWAPPRPVRPWDGVRDASEPGPLCPQVPSPYAPISSTEEDCLVLNVTTPPAEARRPAPVLVWIHGDGAVGGGAFFDGRRLAARGLLVVTVNYRLGVFGGFARPGLPGSGTFGLLDQQAALAWVQRNAAAFGGDPGNVTVAGMSFGASAIVGHLTSPGARGLFHRAVTASGEAMMDMPAGAMGPGVPGYPWYVWRTVRETEETTEAMTAPLGCQDPDPDRSLRCLRALPVKRILEVPHIMNAFVAFPVGNATLPALPPDALRAGRFHRVPVLSGATRDEHRTFVGMLYDAVGRPFTEADYRQSLRTAFGPQARRIRAAYPTGSFPSPGLAWATVVTDRMWARGTEAQHRVLGSRVPTFAYEFADRDAPMYLPLPGRFDFGAFHAADGPYLFEDEQAEPHFTPAQRRLSATMTAYWAAFARTGDPNAPGLPAWPAHRPADRTPYVQSLAPDRIGPVDYRREHRLGFWDRLR
ncbi:MULTISPECIES: carboxylesterase/lipase family protein [unclassified Streptomyces]|uniref:carboxylesterase/lipase family protein n=1 Tax=unclassified Streptomyces TaxID=2593676 RepID=UPI0009A0EB18|nr:MULTISPECIES: carboxylesterase family protein [unclassified Streptomyces]